MRLSLFGNIIIVEHFRFKIILRVNFSINTPTYLNQFDVSDMAPLPTVTS